MSHKKLERHYLGALKAIVREKRRESGGKRIGEGSALAQSERDWTKRKAREKAVAGKAWPIKATHEKDIIDGMGRLAWSSWSADRAEERGRIHAGQQHYRYKPARVPHQAMKWAREVAIALLMQEKAPSLSYLYEIVVDNYGYTGDAEQFGNDLAYEAMGHGVNWRDRADYKRTRNDVIDVPQHEFYM